MEMLNFCILYLLSCDLSHCLLKDIFPVSGYREFYIVPNYNEAILLAADFLFRKFYIYQI